MKLFKIPKSNFRGPFSLKFCIESEQCPSDIWEEEDGKYKSFIKEKDRYFSVKIWEDKKNLFFEAEKDFSKKLFYHFWGDYDLSDFYLKFRRDKYLSKCIQAFPGLRAMRWLDLDFGVLEAILTQNSSVKRIRQMVKDLRNFYGNGLTVDVEKIANAKASEIQEKCKLGYRASYLINLAKLLKTNRSNLEKLKFLETQKAREFLLKIKGVGPKVADIILLYVLGKSDVFPMDVWLKQALIREYFKGKIESNQKLRNFALKYFGKHSGIAHLYMFCYERKGKE